MKYYDEKKSVNFEINLLPVISLLAVCISFLLLTTVWIHIGTLDVKQALGSESATEKTEPDLTLWVTMNDRGDVILQVKTTPDSKAKPIQFRHTKEGVNFHSLETYMTSLKQKHPELKTALILPDRRSSFESLIKTVDLLKKSEIRDVGIAPL